MSAEESSGAQRAGRRPRGGPRTAEGKRTSARNALRHGLSLDLAGDAAARAEQLAVRIAGREPSAERMQRCRAFAYAEIDLWRVRAARAAMIDQAAAQVRDKERPRTEREGAALLAAWPQLVRLERYERRAHSRRKRAIRRLDNVK